MAQVLHSLLEPDTETHRVAVVGISNWILDFAKVCCLHGFCEACNLTRLSVQVNRGCVLSCQPPDQLDLLSTARCIYKSVNETEHVMKQHNDLLDAVCRAYSEYYVTQVCCRTFFVCFVVLPCHECGAILGDLKLPWTSRFLLPYCLHFCEAVETLRRSDPTRSACARNSPQFWWAS